jgi:hypothetical protein
MYNYLVSQDANCYESHIRNKNSFLERITAKKVKGLISNANLIKLSFISKAVDSGIEDVDNDLIFGQFFLHELDDLFILHLFEISYNYINHYIYAFPKAKIKYDQVVLFLR